MLRLQVEFNIRAAGVGVGHISHDIGGFIIARSQLVKNADGTEIVDPERYLRWMQFGVFNSILRFHCAPGSGSRLPYDYDSTVGGACRKWLRIRHSLLPYIYTVSRTYYETGIAPTRGLFIEEPGNPAAYRFDEYPVYVRAGSIIPRQDPDGDIHAGHVERLVLDVYPCAEGSSELYEDDGRSTDYQRGEFCRTRFTLTEAGDAIVLRGEVVEGAPLGAGRQIVVQIALPGARKASARLDDGREVEVRALPEAGRFELTLPPRPAGDAFELRIDLDM